MVSHWMLDNAWTSYLSHVANGNAVSINYSSSLLKAVRYSSFLLNLCSVCCSCVLVLVCQLLCGISRDVCVFMKFMLCFVLVLAPMPRVSCVIPIDRSICDQNNLLIVRVHCTSLRFFRWRNKQCKCGPLFVFPSVWRQISGVKLVSYSRVHGYHSLFLNFIIVSSDFTIILRSA